MNYRHHFHAGNFADLVKHVIFLALIAELRATERPLTVIDTHAGAGLYDLDAEAALRSGEAAAGIGRLAGDAALAGSDLFTPLMQQVRAFNPGALKLYPGSPALAARALARGDRLIACELRAEEAATLATQLAGMTTRSGPDLIARAVDGYDYVASTRADPARATLVLIDPPFEQGDDYDRLVQTAAVLLAQRPQPVVAIWTPIKDLETLDSLVRRLEVLPGATGYVAQTRLRPLVNPMSLNGCAMIVLGATSTRNLAAAASSAVAALCGGPGAAGVTGALGD